MRGGEDDDAHGASVALLLRLMSSKVLWKSVQESPSEASVADSLFGRSTAVRELVVLQSSTQWSLLRVSCVSQVTVQ